VSCRLCAVPLVRVADLTADEYAWANAGGHQTGTDPDVAHLLPDPYGRLAILASELGRAQAVRTKRASRTWLYWARAREYGALKVRLEMGGTFHVHQPDGPGPVHEGPVPEHCNWPGWLRPSGWQCRRCGAALVPGRAS
jgi:hypothetical protein